MSHQLNALLASPTPLPQGVLALALKDYKQPNDKISALLASGVLLSIKRGLYISNQALTQYGAASLIKLIAHTLYGPSYLTSSFALAHYGCIPELAHNATAMTTRRGKHYSTPLGAIDYIHCPAAWFGVGLCLQTDAAGTSLFASPEKALCDKIVFTKSLQIASLKAMRAYLIDDLRFDASALKNLNAAILLECLSVARALNLKVRQLEWLCTCVLRGLI
jgi:hypothetical protein